MKIFIFLAEIWEYLENWKEFEQFGVIQAIRQLQAKHDFTFKNSWIKDAKFGICIQLI